MLIPDHETEIDYLNYEAISQTIVQLLKDNRKQPLTVGIHGDWGAGKSSILKMVETNLNSDQNIVVLWFNGWTFEGFEDAKTVLIENTIIELDRQKSTVGKVKEKVTNLLRRVNWLKIAKRSPGIAFNLTTGLPSPDQIKTALGTIDSFQQDTGNQDSGNFSAILEEVSGYLKPAEIGNDIPETIHQFRKDFQDLLEEAKIEQLVVIIDDLDRCLPATVIQTLEAIRLFLFVPKSAYVIGADEVMIEYAVRQHFPDLPVTSGPLSYARNYLEKLIQVPFRIPALGASETRTYVTLLLVQSIVGENHKGFEELLKKAKECLMAPWYGTYLSPTDVQNVDESRKSELNSAYVLAQQMAPILAEGTKGNPRQIKRFLNAIFVRQSIAEARGFGNQIKQPVLAKLMLAERFQPDFYEQMSMQAMMSHDGKVSDFSILESSMKRQTTTENGKSKDKDEVEMEDASNQSEITKWLERDWLKRWLQIQPELASEDLRPYVFVAREKRLLASAEGHGSLELLISNLCGTEIQVRALEKDVSELTEVDAGIVFNALRERVLSVGSFDTTPQGIDGLAIVAKHHPHLQIELVSLFESFDHSKLGPWAVKGWNEYITESDVFEKLIEIFRGWAGQSENHFLQAAAKGTINSLQQKNT